MSEVRTNVGLGDPMLMLTTSSHRIGVLAFGVFGLGVTGLGAMGLGVLGLGDLGLGGHVNWLWVCKSV